MIVLRPGSGRPCPGPDRVLMVPAASVGRICPHQSDETSHRNVRLGASPDISRGCVVVQLRRTARRLDIIRPIFQVSDTTTVHLKGRVSENERQGDQSWTLV